MTTPADIREQLVQALEADLVGPFHAAGNADSAQEILPLPPSRWYLTGFLAPRGGADPDTDDDSEGELAAGGQPRGDDAGSEDERPKRPVRFPSSMGLSVFLPPAEAGQSDALEVEIRYADYDKVEVALDHESKKRTGWRRLPRGPVCMRVPVDAGVLAAGLEVPESAGLRVCGELRETDMDGLPPGARIMSLFLVNERRVDVDGAVRDRDLAFAFQVRMTLRHERGFLARPNRRGEDGSDDDQRVRALLYRDHVEWAVGHNTSVAAPEVVQRGGERCVLALSTTQLPCYEVPLVEHRKLPAVVTGMAELQGLDGRGLERALMPLVEAYRGWIDRQRYRVLERDALETTRDALMDRAAAVCERVREGIHLLVSDAEVREAFKLANQAMHVAALQADRSRTDKRYVDGRKPAWRPFQLAFLLMNLPAIADPGHRDRDIADLIYFPTGGGKTEAYLGLIAFTLLLRRMRGKRDGRPDEGRGVAVILRYTLRLLTLDQLGRAATLMCALEAVRRRDPGKLGNTRFAVGLWVGVSATANRLKDVHHALHDYSKGAGDSPFPLTRCPWCGDEITIENIKLVDGTGTPMKTAYTRVVVYCHGADCQFTERKMPGQGLPVLFVDEQIYQELPDFLVATVDKFAMLPWRGEAGMLFGQATHIDSRRAYGVMHEVPRRATPLPHGLRPPELIVQDEMHLISGPLGTMVGLYESAVDYLAEHGPRAPGEVLARPKVVCSTATVRRARDQIRALFGREMALFPPRGMDADDNFFAVADRTRPGRLYVGVGAPGRALRTVSVRAYATLLAAAQRHYDPRGAPDQPADPYMTLVGYFNSLRELGGMRRLVEDEVRNRVADFGDKRPHHVVGPHPWAADRRVRMPAELTSRESTDRVKQTKQRLATRMTSSDDVSEPVDVVLASSMISVGLDVDRLGLMVVTGQPKTTSEYIQATSRVGRAYPGLVVTCLNVMRPRDRSHYERFVAYHESFYRDVEATSVTPFSGQTLDRGLAGTLLAMIRHGIPAMQAPEGAMALHDHRPAAERILEWLVERARTHREWDDNEAEGRISDLLRRRGKNFLDAWEKVVMAARRGAGVRIYSGLDRAGEKGKPLMYSAADDVPVDLDERRFEAPTSMRDVEPSVHVWMRFKQLDERTR